MTDRVKVDNFLTSNRSTPFEELLDSKKASSYSTSHLERPLTNAEIPDYIPRWDGAVERSNGVVEKLSLHRRAREKFAAAFRKEPLKVEEQVEDGRKVDLSVQSIGSRPPLPKPSHTVSSGLDGLVAALASVKEKKLVRAVGVDGAEGSVDERVCDWTEAEVERSVYEVQKRQVVLREEGGITLKDNILQDSIERKRLWNIYSDLLEEAREKAKSSKIFDWISIGAGVVGAAVMIGSLVALALASGGLVLPALLAVAGGIAAIAGGGSAISSAIFKHQGDVVTGDAFVNRHKQAMKKDEILAKLQDMRENNNSMVQVWSNISQLLRNSSVNLFR